MPAAFVKETAGIFRQCIEYEYPALLESDKSPPEVFILKRILILCLGLMLFASAHASPMPVRYEGGMEVGGFSVLLAEDGTPLTPRDTYGGIYPIGLYDENSPVRMYMATEVTMEVEPGTDPYMQPYRYALMNESGKLLTGFDYTSFSHYPGLGIIVFTGMDNFEGVMNEQGEVILPAKYINICPNYVGGYLALDPCGQPYDYNARYPVVYIDDKGRSFKTDFTSAPYNLSGFSGGFCQLNIPDDSDGLRSVILDFEGTDVFGKEYGWIDRFIGDYAVVTDRDTGRCGLIDRNGNFATELIYTSIDAGISTEPVIFLACDESGATILDSTSLEALGRIDYAEYGLAYAWYTAEHYICASGDTNTCLFDLQGNLLLQTEGTLDVWYSHADGKPERVVISDNNWPLSTARLADLEGNTYGPEFRYITPSVWKDGHGRFIFTEYELTVSPDGETYPDWDSYRYGLCDESGNILLDAKYTNLEYMAPGRWWARLGPRTGMIDDTGKWYYAINDYEYLMD